MHQRKNTVYCTLAKALREHKPPFDAATAQVSQHPAVLVRSDQRDFHSILAIVKKTRGGNVVHPYEIILQYIPPPVQTGNADEQLCCHFHCNTYNQHC